MHLAMNKSIKKNNKQFFENSKWKRSRIAVSLLSLILLTQAVHAQKPILQPDSYKKFTSVDDGSLSDNGKYASYRVNNLPFGKFTTVIMATDKSWKKEYVGLKNPKFSSDNKHLTGILPGDTLLILGLGKGKEEKTPQVTEQLFLINKGKEYIAYKTATKDLIISTIKGPVINKIPLVDKFFISPDGNEIISTIKTNTDKYQLLWTTLNPRASKIIYEGSQPSNVIFNDPSSMIAFTTGKNESYNYWLATKNTQAQIVPESSFSNISNKLLRSTGRYWGFSKNGESLFFYLVRKPAKPTNNLDVDVWDYRDAYLKSYFYGSPSNDTPPPTYEYLCSINTRTMLVQQHTNLADKIVTGGFEHNLDTILVVNSQFGNNYDRDSALYPNDYFIKFLNSGRKISFGEGSIQFKEINLSPNGKYLVYYNSSNGKYFSINVITGEKREFIVPISLHFDYAEGNPKRKMGTPGIVSWLKDDVAIIQGTYDLISLNVQTGQHNILTNKLGEKDKKQFGPLKFYRPDNNPKGILFCYAFDTKDKSISFCTLSADGISELKGKTNAYIDGVENGYGFFDKKNLILSKNGSCLVRWQDYDLPPNYSFTKDFKSFTKLSSYSPQKDFNWLTCKLYNYSDSLGNDYQGILYKPENFDSKKKYPLILNYYTQKSDLLHCFPEPEPRRGEISIPLLVSRGYLVFQPDMKTAPKHVGNANLLSIDAAVNQISKFDFVDHKKMAISGGSYGGFETNLLLTKTTKFAAAISMAGIYNVIGSATDLQSNGSAGQDLYNKTSMGFVNNYYDDMETYIENSPNLNVKKVNTPLLLIHNDHDGGVSFIHSRSFFLELRRMNKPVWWLNYKNEDHGVSPISKRIDLFYKILDFYDHFLKDKPMESWLNDPISVEVLK